MINYGFIAKAIKEYQKLGYVLLNVPWMVGKKSIGVTLPPGKKSFQINLHSKNNYLVGSAEQSFIHLAMQKSLPFGKYVAATPCFRDDAVDLWHQKYFFKVELIDFGSIGEIGYFNSGRIMRHARDFMASLTNKSIVIENSDDSGVDNNFIYDLNINGIEVGSYGYRTYKSKTNSFAWAYGTGIAEPRFSTVIGM